MQPSRGPRPAASRGEPELRETAVPYFARPMAELSVRFDSELSTWLRLTAQARAGSPQTLAAELLTRGLQQEVRRDRTRSLLQRLTPRERQVTELTARGRTNRQIAYALRISTETVKSHIRSTLGKFGLHSKADLRVLLKELGDLDG